MNKTLKKSLVALRATAVALLALVFLMGTPIIASASDWVGGNEPVVTAPVVTAPAETAGLGFWMWFMIILVAIMAIGIVVYLLIARSKQRKAELQEIVSVSQQAVVSVINPLYRVKNNGTSLDLYEETPVNRTVDPTTGTAYFGTAAPATPAPGSSGGTATAWY